jgi:glycosyltransferase involved in cell wall biosynthesis
VCGVCSSLEDGIALKILITADPYIPVPPTGYGGIERVVSFLVRGLVGRGHSVTLVAHPNSQIPGAEILGYGCAPHFTRAARAKEIAQVGKILHRLRDRVDVVHSFGRLAGLVLLLPRRQIAKVQSYQRRVPWRSVRVAQTIAGASLRFTGCSSSLYRGPDGGNPPAGRWSTIFNGVDTSLYRAREAVSVNAPLAFLGRLERIKGVHHAIAIAKMAGRRLVIAGNRVEEGSARGYFEKEIAPYVDGETIRWIGPVDDAAKNELLGAAAALLMPIEWEEPFGIVMVEAMACGTPVIAFRRGSVPEVLRDGTNGFSCDTVPEAAAAVGRLDAIDRATVRKDCEVRFGADRIVDAYESCYREVLNALPREARRYGTP